MPGKNKFYNVESMSGSVIEIHPDQKDYFVVTNIKGGEAPNSTLRFNSDESALLTYLGNDALTLKIVPEQNKKGVYETNMMIKGSYPMGRDINKSGHHELTIEDFEAIGKDKVIMANSLGVLDLYQYSLVPQQSQVMGVNASQLNTQVKLAPARRLDSFDINQGKQIQAHEMITSISVFQNPKSTQDPLVAVSTIQNNVNGDAEGKLKAIHIYKVNQASNKIELVCYKDFGWQQNNKSLYYWLDFTHMYKGQNVLYAFQNEDQKKLDMFVMNWNAQTSSWNLDQFHSQPNYSNEYFTAIRARGNKIVNIDYDGVMKILDVPQ